MKTVSILFPVGSITGMGHFKRSEILAKYLKSKKFKINKLPLHDKKLSTKTKNYCQKYFEKIFKLKNSDILIIDFSSNTVIRQYKNIKKIIFKLSEKKTKKIIVIDSIRSEKLYNKYCEKRIIPYFINKKKKIEENFKYILLDPKLFKIKMPCFKKKFKILITFGGSDIINTKFIIDKLLKLNHSNYKKYSCKIIVGKFCKKSFFNKIVKKLKKYSNFEVIHGTNNMNKYYSWCNVVICSDSITKYEVLASGRYAIMINTSRSNEIYGRDFNKLSLFSFIKKKDQVHFKDNILNLDLNNLSELKKLTTNVNQFKKKINFKNNLDNYLNLINEQMI